MMKSELLSADIITSNHLLLKALKETRCAKYNYYHQLFKNLNPHFNLFSTQPFLP